MPIEVIEAFDSRSGATGENASKELKYFVHGTNDDKLATEALEAAAPDTWNGLYYTHVTIEPMGDGSEWWAGTAHYGPKGEPQAGDSSWTFDTTGGTQHVTQSLSTVHQYSESGGTVGTPNYEGAIGVTDDNVEGVDITIPVYAFSETHYLADNAVTAAYKGKLFKLTGTVNNAAFKGCAAGECLFLGATGTKRGSEKWEITFKFAALPNKAQFTVGNITVTNGKKGWDYMWVRYGKKVDGNSIVQVPVGVYIEKIYEDGDFSQLGIGV